MEAHAVEAGAVNEARGVVAIASEAGTTICDRCVIVDRMRDGEVLKVAANVGPWRVRWCRRAHWVLELAAGEAATRGVVRGQRLTAG
jgi:Uncharacterized ACR, COG1430